MQTITSSSNEKFKYFRTLLSKKGRDESGEYMVEGVKSVMEAVTSEKCRVCAVIVRNDLAASAPTGDFPVYAMPPALADRLSDTKTPPGIFAVIKKTFAVPCFKPDGAYVYCDRVSDPGNLGTIIRTADSAGFDGVLLSPGCVEACNPKTVRSCMGSFFHTDVFENVTKDILEGFPGRIYGGILTGDTKDYREVDYSGGVIIAVGNESSGISDGIKEICCPVKIPIYGKAESLNAAVAASLLIYEAANRRNVK
ncbi:MAG: RNA methyltransferase [Clostridia bacterium]|nr:RNA methyltransferase [Clostridia bacterium]